ncbi:T9SS-dependent choice-of-anchor J family protein [Flavobacterium difficile]|uniref:T9SS type A sorting domain-containing protein n=1 Tax=Flavobacterium difficile TaxID=2709659 RepID=A0ABX0I6T2_9FLAO|nr:choice-of-anchor J domain-containing protein [Flavobacterium difficile]NHM02644.1 T9SS type A sorting domain-containing protein [Flavobacterium difficile]
MKKITFFLFFVLYGISTLGQTTVTIGTGVLSATSANGSPVYRSSATSTFNFSQSVELLTPADLSAVGITAGSTITKIAYKKLNASTLSPGRTATMRIFMKNTATTALGTTTNFATYTTGSTLCYDNAVYSNTDLPAVAGWVEFNFSTPFNYTGGSIEVGIDWAINAGTGNPTDGAFAWEYTTVSANQAAGTSAGAAITGNLATANTRIYNTQLTFTNNPCSGVPAPGNTVVSTSGCFGSSATLSLQNPTIGSGVTYQWYMNTVAISGATNPNYVIPSLTTSDTYFCEVTCAGNTSASSSLLVGPSILTTPVLEPFAVFLPTCWMNMFGGDLTTGPTASTGSGWVADGFANSGTTGAIRNEIWTVGANDWVISPVVNIPAVGYELKFDAAATQFASVNSPTTPWEADDFIEVLIATGGSTTNWIVLNTFNDTNVPSNIGSSYIYDLSAYAGQNVRIAFRAVEGTANGLADIDFSIDNFQIRQTPACSEPTGITIGNITSSSVEFSWTEPTVAPSVGYEYIVSTSNTIPTTAGTPTTNTFGIPTGLLSNTTYYVFVRSDCGASGFSTWVGPVSFTTLCAPVTAPVSENFTTFLPSVCWFNRTGGDLTTGPTSLTGSGWVADGFANAGTTGAIKNEIWTTGANDWFISPEITIPSTGYELKFDAAATQFATTNLPTTPWESDDFIEVLVSTTGLTNWTPIFTYNDSNQPSNTATPNVLDLDAYAGQNIRIAFRAVEGATNGSADIDFSIDNFQVRLTPTCIEPSNLVFSSVTATTANISWEGTTPVPTIGYEYFVSTTNAVPVTAGTATTNTFAALSTLLPQTTYYIFVRSDCGGGDFSPWIGPISFTTACSPVATLPWIQNFDSVTVPAIPTCWSEENGDYVTAIAGTYNTPRSGANYLRDSWSASNEYMWTPGFDLIAGTSYDFSSWIQGDGGTGWTVDYFVNSSQNSTGATQLGGQYAVPGTGTIAIQTYAQVTRSFVPSTSGTYYFAFRVNQPSITPWYVAFDDVEVKLSPACPTPSASVSGITDVAANLTWSAVPSATLGYEYVLDNVATDPTGAGTSTTATTFPASGLTPLTTYYFHIRSVCAAGTFSTWSTVSFTTLATPPANDNCATASVLVPGGVFATNFQVASNVGATGSTAPAPGCASYLGGDVWYSITIPASGNLTIETRPNATSPITDTGIAVYSGSCGALVLVECDDDDSASGNFSLISLTGRTAGEVLYVRAWEFGNDTFNTFQISAYDASLSSDSFDSKSFVAYPNPVKDILNLSYKTTISNVRVVNLLGQEVLNTNVNATDVQVNMVSLTAGTYIVNVTVDDTIHTLKVVKQ